MSGDGETGARAVDPHAPVWDAHARGQGQAGPPYRLPAPCQPQAISYDPVDEENAELHGRMLTDPGVQPRRGETVALHAVAWTCAPYGMPNPKTGFRTITACLAIMACDGLLYRFFGWDVITEWAGLVLSCDPASIVQGIDVVVRSAESPAADHWWWIVERGGT